MSHGNQQLYLSAYLYSPVVVCKYAACPNCALRCYIASSRVHKKSKSVYVGKIGRTHTSVVLVN